MSEPPYVCACLGLCYLPEYTGPCSPKEPGPNFDLTAIRAQWKEQLLENRVELSKKEQPPR